MTDCQNAYSIKQICDISKLFQATCSDVIREITSTKKYKIRPPLYQKHKSKTFKMVRKYRKVGFIHVIFTHECLSICMLCGLDEWDKF